MNAILRLLFLLIFVVQVFPQTSSEFNRPWISTDNPLILDAYHKNPIDWNKLKQDTRVAAIIHKATQGKTLTDPKYQSRRIRAKSLGYKWGSFHLLTTGNTIRQANHYLKVIGKNPADELMALDVECTDHTECGNDEFRVSAEEIKTFLRHIKLKTGRYPILYANHSVTRDLSIRFRGDKLLGAVALWYARFKGHVTNFPKGIWKTYSVWQFASEINCVGNSRKHKLPVSKCPYSVPGTDRFMDIDIFNGSVEELRKNWATLGTGKKD